jgi:dGTPase
MKVGQVARGLAQRLEEMRSKGELGPNASRLVDCLDGDATEAAALAHDLGHPPFGHLAEKVLEALSKDASFEGNAQSFRIVTRLALRSEIRDSEGSPRGGLNLTRRTLNGLLKYPWVRAEQPPGRWKKWGAYTDGDKDAFDWARKGYGEGPKTLEACLMDWADDVTYAVHDMDDFYRARLIPLERLSTSDSSELRGFKEYLQEWAEEEDEDADRIAHAADVLFTDGILSYVTLPFSGLTDERVQLRKLGSKLIGLYIAAPQLRDVDEQVEFEIAEEIVDQVNVLKRLTWYYVINRPSLSVIQRGQKEIIERLFAMYKEGVEEGELHLMPPLFAQRIQAVSGDASRERVIIDLIAGMTETAATEIHRQRFGVTGGSLLTQIAGPA